jgi:hypothetical protein
MVLVASPITGDEPMLSDACAQDARPASMFPRLIATAEPFVGELAVSVTASE